MDKSLESSERGGVFRVWSLPPWIIQSSEEVAEESSIQQVYVEGEGGGCISCGITSPFEDRKAMTDHFRSSLHVLNIRRRMKGLPAVSIETEVEDEEDEVSRLPASCSKCIAGVMPALDLTDGSGSRPSSSESL